MDVGGEDELPNEEKKDGDDKEEGEEAAVRVGVHAASADYGLILLIQSRRGCEMGRMCVLHLSQAESTRQNGLGDLARRPHLHRGPLAFRPTLSKDSASLPHTSNNQLTPRHLPILRALWSLPDRPVAVSERIPLRIRIIAYPRHALRQTVRILYRTELHLSISYEHGVTDFVVLRPASHGERRERSVAAPRAAQLGGAPGDGPRTGCGALAVRHYSCLGLVSRLGCLLPSS